MTTVIPQLSASHIFLVLLPSTIAIVFFAFFAQPQDSSSLCSQVEMIRKKLTLLLFSTFLVCFRSRTTCIAFVVTTAANDRSSTSRTNVFVGFHDNDNQDELSLEAFQKVKKNSSAQSSKRKSDEEFDGYAFRDVIYAKWGRCFDVEFQRVDSFGFRKINLNILPFHLGSRPFRHASEYDYLCHLQAVVEILQEYKQLDYVLYQIAETNKRPIPRRSPLVAVPCRLDLTNEQIEKILGGRK